MENSTFYNADSGIVLKLKNPSLLKKARVKSYKSNRGILDAFAVFSARNKHLSSISFSLLLLVASEKTTISSLLNDLVRVFLEQ